VRASSWKQELDYRTCFPGRCVIARFSRSPCGVGSQPFLPINRVDTRAGPIEAAPYEFCNEIIIDLQNF
jgi:hypothetical protein